MGSKKISPYAAFDNVSTSPNSEGSQESMDSTIERGNKQSKISNAIKRNEKETIELLLTEVSKKDLNYVPLSIDERWEGGIAKLGQLPLLVAALKFDKDTFSDLLNRGASIIKQNYNGDTVLHVMITYLSKKPQKEQIVRDMLEFIHEKLVPKAGKTDNLKLWFTNNYSGYTPLKLAAFYRLPGVVEFILHLKNVYCFSDHKTEGLFDINTYDMTEFDPISNYNSTRNATKNNDPPSEPNCFIESILELMFHNDYTRPESTSILDIAPVKTLLQKKWHRYRIGYGIWGIVHFTLMVALSVYAVHKSRYTDMDAVTFEVYKQNNAGEYLFIYGFKWVAFAVSILYIVFSASLCFFKIRRSNISSYWRHNLMFIILIVIFSLSVAIDAIMIEVYGENYNSILITLALFTGWWFSVFFLRAWRRFSIITVMLKNAIQGDFKTVSFLICIQLVAFSTCMHILFQGSDVFLDGEEFDRNNNNFGRTMITMFRLMIGLNELENLSKARIPWLAFLLVVIFVLLTYLILLNALIAMMSTTCENILKQRFSVWRYEQLSVVLFLERGLMPIVQRCYRPVTRYFLDMKSEKRLFESEEDVVTRNLRKKEHYMHVHNRELAHGRNISRVYTEERIPNEHETPTKQKGKETHSFARYDEKPAPKE